MEDQTASRIVPTALVESTIHEEFPVIDKKSYIDRSIDKIVPSVIFPESTDLEGITMLEFVIHQTAEHYIDLSSIEIELKDIIRRKWCTRWYWCCTGVFCE